MLPKNKWKTLLGVALGIGGMLSLIASSSPDGLEKIAELQGFLDRGTALFTTPFQGYAFSGRESGALSTSFSGIFGVAIVFLGLWFFGIVLFSSESTRRRSQR